MSKPEILIERKISCGGYGYIVREHCDFPEGTEIAYRDSFASGKDTAVISLASTEDLDALIACLVARRAELVTTPK